MMTLAEAQAQMTTVTAAINSLLSGNKMTKLEVGSGTFKRVYTYQEITLDTLTSYRNELQGIINALTEANPTFRTNATIPLIIAKGPY